MSEIDTILISPLPNGAFEIANKEQANRAAFFGDGLFETMIFQDNKIRFSTGHQQRLEEGLNQLKLNPTGISTIEKIENYLQEKFQHNGLLRVRWNVFRSGLGKYTPQSNNCQELILLQPHTLPPKIKYTSYISKMISVPRSTWSHCKTLNALTYVMANIERKEKGMNEVILLDDRSFVSEAGAANIFWVKNGIYYTPSLDCNCIAGVGRKAVIHHLHKNNTAVIQGAFRPEDLMEAEQVFTTNVTGISYIKKIMEKEFSVNPISMIESVFI